jgi:hypothetical protein
VTTAGAVGTYIFAQSSGAVNFGSTYAGSTLGPGGLIQSGCAAQIVFTATAQSGTWRAMGYLNGSGNTLFVRIA